MVEFLRTHANHPDFKRFIVDLDSEFKIRYPESQHNFQPYNEVDASARVIIGFTNQQPIGCGCFRTTIQKSTIEIKRMYVVHDFRNRGIGKRILELLEQWAVEQGFTTAILETGVNQPEAIAAYRRSGYQLIPNFPPYDTVMESICMEKKLKSG